MDAAQLQLSSLEHEAGCGVVSAVDSPPFLKRNAAGVPPPVGWVALGTTPVELTLDHCLPTGQSFRWQQLGPSGLYAGVIGQRLVYVVQADGGDVHYHVAARGPGALPEQDDATIRDYFNLPSAGNPGVCLSDLSVTWSKACTRYARVAPYLPGARMLRQDPVECLFQFICSSNNHISRIHGMVTRLASQYGTLLVPAGPTPPHPHLTTPAASPAPPPHITEHSAGAGAATSDEHGEAAQGAASSSKPPADPGRRSAAGGGKKRARSRSPPPATADADGSPADLPAATAGGAMAAVEEVQHFAFPTLEQLSRATEDELRDAGFGYRARFIVESVAQLREQPEGGAAWLLGLRTGASTPDAIEALTTLTGVGPKVAACVALFSLDKHDAIPVDTHVWQIAAKYYMPSLKGKSLTKKMHGDVQAAFTGRFGPYAGWAHNALFIAELSSHRDRIPGA